MNYEFPDGTLMCPWHGLPSHFTFSAAFRAPPALNKGNTDCGVWCCDACMMPVMGVVRSGNSFIGPHPEFWREPRTRRAPDYPDVPEQIAGVAQEAHACFGVDAYRGSVTMARRALQEAARSKGATDSSLQGKLFNEIDWLAENGHITEPLREGSHALREGGNDAAHPNDFDPTPEDAEDYLTVMDQLLDHLFQAPARVARLKAKRTEVVP